MVVLAKKRSKSVKLDDGIEIARRKAQEVWEQQAAVRANVLIDAEQMPDLFEGHQGQIDLWVADSRFIAAFAGWQSGKTTVGPYWLLREMQRRGPGDYAVIAPNSPMLKNKAKPELQKLFRGLYHSSGDEWIITDAGAKASWGFIPDAPARIIFRHGMYADAIEAFTAKAIWVDEPGQIADEVWEAIQARAMFYEGRILLTSRPYEHNWYVRDFWLAVMEELPDGSWIRKADADPLITTINFRTIDNPGIPHGDYWRQKKKLPAWKHKMKFDGIPTKPAGAIYDCFERKLHVVDSFKVPDHWPRYMGVDFGPKNTCGFFAAYDEEHDRYVVYRTYLNGGLTPGYDDENDEPGHIDNFLKNEPKDVQGKTLHPTAWGGGPSEDKLREEYTKAGFHVRKPSFFDVKAGIEIVYGLIKTGRLVFMSHLTNLITEIENYTLELDEDGEPTEKIKDQNKFHRCDGMRYFGVGVAGGAEFKPVSSTRRGKTSNEEDRRKHEPRTSRRARAEAERDRDDEWTSIDDLPRHEPGSGSKASRRTHRRGKAFRGSITRV